MITTIAYKNIMLWRHADALAIGDNIPDDISRPLSKKGRQQAKTMAAWLKRYLPKDTIIISSNAVRSKQTAQALTNDFQISDELGPSATLLDVLETINSFWSSNHTETNLLIIGHQPWLGQLADYLLNTMPAAEGLQIKKAALWWFKRLTSQPSGTFDLITVQTPSLL